MEYKSIERTFNKIYKYIYLADEQLEPVLCDNELWEAIANQRRIPNPDEAQSINCKNPAKTQAPQQYSSICLDQAHQKDNKKEPALAIEVSQHKERNDNLQ